MAKTDNKYSIQNDEQPAMVCESEATYMSSPVQSHIILNIPQGIDAAHIREKVNTYYNQLLHDCMVEQKFNHHYNKWISETGPLSSPHSIADNEHLREIVKMGKPVVPFIVEKLKTEHSLIYLALEQIYHKCLSTPQTLDGNSRMCTWNPKENIRLWIERLS